MVVLSQWGNRPTTKIPTNGKTKQEVEMDEWAEDMWTAIADQDRKIEEAKK